ncbi:Transposase family tnp2 [Rhizoctonia solani]|uniref:Transposase family tnp2 n=1 Tax=Rhizoctonia solani TaxID=456999 RepID=A0A8H8NYJ2_9AGAM|nr:Transposase family tnp2 [Rhizoctonia solani]QRW21895.1 Transposase family tnp2 [Rhizoctonia solani]
MIRRTSIQAVFSQNNSQNANLDPPHSPPPPASPPVPNTNANDLNELDDEDFGFDNNIPLADPSIWDKLLQHRYHDEISNNELRPTPEGTATRSEPDNPEELDNISVETLSDYLGNIDMAACGLSAEDIMDAEDIVEAVVEGGGYPQSLLFDLCVRFKPTEEFFAELIRRYQPIDSAEGTRIPSIKRLRTLTRKLSGLSAKRHHCCVNSCVAFIGYLGHMDTCPVCHEPRLDSAGKPRNIFTTIPLIPQLRSLFACPITAEKMRHRHTYTNDKNTMADVFDSLRYLELRDLYVVIDGKPMPYKYFEEEHEIALGIGLDGACPFKRRTNTCWPILIINYNLSSEERTRIENMICVGIIPGPQCPADINSFLQPLIDELRELARGVATVDANQRRLFSLRAHLLTIFGDIPALTKILELIGHNGCLPCRFCFMPTVLGPTSGGGSHRYCPLHQPNGFRMDPLDLPLREHNDSICTGLKVLNAKNEAERKRLATESGIKGVTLFARVPSVSIPRSFPVDLMHLIWQNLIPQLIDLWTGDFNDLDSGLEDYQFKQDVWNAVCEACIPSRRTMPTALGCPVPDPRKRSQFIAETWNGLTTQMAPSLLRERFSDQRYYQHFVRLVKLLSLVVSFDLSRDDIPEIRQGFAEWVEEYEQIYYQFDEDRLQTCPVNIHYLLHVADSLEYMGPLWAYWAYPMERFCSFIINSVKSRRYPYANIDERILNRARLQIILRKYRLIDKEPFALRYRPDESENATMVRGYPLAYLLSPHLKHLHVDQHLRRQIVRYLTTCFEILAPAAEALIPNELEQWGRLRIGNGGDTIHARGFHKLRADGRDASFVRYQLMVDQLADDARASPEFKEESQYGQLRHIFVLTIPPKTRKINPDPKKKQYLLLAQIYEAPVHIDEADEYRVVWYKGKLGTGEVVDVSTIHCVVGRIQDGNQWWIIDRSADNALAHPEFVD